MEVMEQTVDRSNQGFLRSSNFNFTRLKSMQCIRGIQKIYLIVLEWGNSLGRASGDGLIKNIFQFHLIFYPPPDP